MKLNKTHKKFIKSNYKKMTPQQMADTLKVNVDEIKDLLKEKGKDQAQSVQYIEDKNQENISSIQDIKNILIENKFVLCVITFFIGLVYFNLTFNGFVSDDIPGFVNYPLIKDIWASFSTLAVNNILYSLSYYFFDTNPVPLHIASILLHVIATITLFVLAYCLFKEKIALMTSFLFALHPLNTEAIAWISANGYLFTAIASFITLVLYIISRKSNNKKLLGITVAIFCIFLVMVRNPLFLTTPFSIAIIETFIFQKKWNIKNLVKSGLFFGWFFLAALLFFLVFLKDIASERLQTLESVYFLDPGKTEPFLIRAPYSISKNLELMIFPKNLTFYHEGDLVHLAGILLVTLAFIVSIIYLWFKNRPLSAMLVLLPTTVLPTFSPIQISWYVAERYLYMTNAFFCIILAHFLLWSEKKLKVRYFAVVSLVIILCLYSIKTISRNNDWKDEKTLWIATQQVSTNSPQAYNNLGDMYAKEKNWVKSAEMFLKAIQLYPTYVAAYHNLGNTYLQMNDLDRSEAAYKKAIELRPDLYQSISNLGVIEYKRENYAKARQYFEQALSIKSDLPEALNGLKALEAISK